MRARSHTPPCVWGVASPRSPRHPIRIHGAERQRVLARRQNRHARRVRSPDLPDPRTPVTHIPGQNTDPGTLPGDAKRLLPKNPALPPQGKGRAGRNRGFPPRGKRQTGRRAGFPLRGKVQTGGQTRFPPEGKVQTGRRAGFPPRGKPQTGGWTGFPPGGGGKGKMDWT
jgi:hypothetical protein